MPRNKRFPIRFGLTVQPENASWAEMVKVWQLAEKVGYDACFTSDHMIPVLYQEHPDYACMDGWSVLTGMAALTRRLRLGVMITGVTYRQPAILAKMATTVDHISGGRLIMGIGAAWNVREHTAYGIPFFPNAERIYRLRETVQILKALWTQPRTTFEGKYYQIADAPFSPKPVQQPHPPIWVGGWGEQLTLKVVAQLADGWNTTGSPTALRHKLDALYRHCDTFKRDPDAIEKSVMHLRLIMTKTRSEAERAIEAFRGRTGRSATASADDYMLGTPEDMKDLIGRLIDLGFTCFSSVVTTPYDHDGIQRFAEEVIPAFR